MNRKPGTPPVWQVALAVAWLSIVAALMAAEFDRLYLANGDSYPRWMTRETLGTVDSDKLTALRAGECAHTPVEIFKKSNGFVLRCGHWFAQPSTRTYFTEAVELDGAYGYRQSDKD